MRRLVPVVCLLAVLAACGGSLADQEKAARDALGARDWSGALRVADAALATSEAKSQQAAAWRLEQIRLDALAGGAQGQQVVSSLERLAQAYPQQATSALYRALADKLRAAGDTPGAIDVLVAGDRRFPSDHAVFAEAIESLQKSGLDPAEVERLKALGYL